MHVEFTQSGICNTVDLVCSSLYSEIGKISKELEPKTQLGIERTKMSLVVRWGGSAEVVTVVLIGLSIGEM